ncbi:MAG TPA: hypothetical protein VMI31_06945, partial [Fimbriimonadaceae bacterium]|nr:hypothetical protein [Fimbriimonadaceae bacterium]
MRRYVIAFFAAGAATAAQCQLIISSTSTGSGLARAVYYDLGAGTTTTLWSSGSNNSGYGIVADDNVGKLYYVTGARLGSAGYGPAPLTAAAIAGLYFPDNATVANAWDLAEANGNLYTWTHGSGTSFTRGIYQAPTLPNAQNHLVLSPLWLDSPTTGNQYAFQGLTYRPADGLFYGVNMITDHALGLYSIDAFGSGAVTYLAPMPSGHTHVDGLTFDATGTTAYMTEQNPTDQKIYIFSLGLASLTYGSTYAFSYTDATQRGTGVT